MTAHEFRPWFFSPLLTVLLLSVLPGAFLADGYRGAGVAFGSPSGATGSAETFFVGVPADVELDLGLEGNLRPFAEATLRVEILARRDVDRANLTIAATEGVRLTFPAQGVPVALLGGEKLVRRFPVMVTGSGDQRIAATVSGDEIISAYRAIYVFAKPESVYVGDRPYSGLSGPPVLPVQDSPPLPTKVPFSLQAEPTLPEPTQQLGQDEFGFVPQNPGTVVVQGRWVFRCASPQ